MKRLGILLKNNETKDIIKYSKINVFVYTNDET